MKRTIYLLPFLLFLNCKGKSRTLFANYSEIRNNLHFTFEAHTKQNGLSDLKTEIDVSLTNIGKDTLYFYEGRCSYWINDNPVNLHYYATGVQCFDTLPEIVLVAPKETVKHQFEYYVENESDLIDNLSFGITCYPVEPDFQLTPENEAKYLKNRKKLVFTPANVSVF